MKKKLNSILLVVSIVLFVVLIIDCFFVKKLSIGAAFDEMWEAFLPTILLVLATSLNSKK